MSKYNEAQFMIEGSTGNRTPLLFSALGNDFCMDAYVWGVDEQDAKIRMVSVHGVSPGVSRTRWHPLGERLSKEVEGVRFVALDWHSIDRTDKPQDTFLTMLPKHFWTGPTTEFLDDILQESTPEAAAEVREMFAKLESEDCPRSIDQAADVLRAIIEQGLGWGTADTQFIPCIKSWSGGVGVRMLAKANREFKKNVPGAIIMHAASFDTNDIKGAVKDIPTLLCWAKDDPLVPYKLSEQYLVHANVQRITYDEGGHANFDGTGSLPNFDDEIISWLRNLS